MTWDYAWTGINLISVKHIGNKPLKTINHITCNLLILGKQFDQHVFDATEWISLNK